MPTSQGVGVGAGVGAGVGTSTVGAVFATEMALAAGTAKLGGTSAKVPAAFTSAIFATKVVAMVAGGSATTARLASSVPSRR